MYICVSILAFPIINIFVSEEEIKMTNSLCDADENISSIIIGFTIIIGCLIIYCFGMKAIFDDKLYSYMPCVILYGITLISYACSFSISLIGLLLPFYPKCNELNSNILKLIEAFGSSFYYVGLTHGYLFYLCRLKLIFTDTKYSLTKLMFIIFIILYILQIICVISYTYFTIICGKCINNSIKLYQNIVIIMIILSYIIATFMLAVIFISKAVKLSKNNTKNNVNILIRSVKIYVLFTYIYIRIYICVYLIRLRLAARFVNSLLLILIKDFILIGLYIILTNNFVFDYMTLIIGAGINIFLIHLQFNFMNKCYLCLCDPLKKELNNNIYNIQTTINELNGNIQINTFSSSNASKDTTNIIKNVSSLCCCINV